MVNTTATKQKHFETKMMFIKALFVCLVLYVDVGEARSINAQGFLQQFGYLKNGRTVERGLKNFQKFYGLKQTGVLDSETTALMKTSRCGVEDPQTDDNSRKRRSTLRILNRRRRFVLTGYDWKPLFAQTNENKLKWTLQSTGTQALARDQILTIMRRAFSAWAVETNLIFEEVAQEDVDTIGLDNIELIIFFASGKHGDGPRSRFDGEGGVLAHAYFPYSLTEQLAGDAHFDDDENYTDGVDDGINLLWVAVHEFGHSLGLSHSNNQDAIMYAFYRGYNPNFELHPDDVAGIQALYGAPVGPPTEDPTETTEDPNETTAAPPETTEEQTTTPKGNKGRGKPKKPRK